MNRLATIAATRSTPPATTSERRKPLIHDVLKATGRPHLVLRFAIFKLVCIGSLGVPALLWYGLDGMCWLILATYAVGFLWELWSGARALDIAFTPTLLIIVRVLVVALVCIEGGHALLTSLLGHLATWQLAVGIVLTGSAYAAVTTVIDPEGLNDVRLLLGSRAAA